MKQTHLLTAALLLGAVFSSLATTARAAVLWSITNETYNSVTFNFQGLTQEQVDNEVANWGPPSFQTDQFTSAIYLGQPRITLGMQRAGVGLGLARADDPDNNTPILAWVYDEVPATGGADGPTYIQGNFNFTTINLPVSGTTDAYDPTPDATLPFSTDVNGTVYAGTASYYNLGQDLNTGSYYGSVTFSLPTLPQVPEPSSIALLGLGGLALLRRRR